MPSNYPHSPGALHTNDRKTNDKHPDLRGSLDISPDQIRILIEMSKAGVQPKLQIGAWYRTSQAGNPYISLDGEAYFDPSRQQQHQQAAPSGHRATMQVPQQMMQPPQQMMPQQPMQPPQQPMQPPQQPPPVQQPPAPQPIQPLQPTPGAVPQDDFEDDDIPW
jgi:hypothetical protein